MAVPPRTADLPSGYQRLVAELADKAKDVVHAVEHPIETAKALEHEAEVGASARTPLIALTGVTLVLGVILAVMLVITMTLYFVYGGR
jgi:hypothetical protein